MMHLQSDHHSDQVLAALQNKTGCDILLIGNDNVNSHSDSLWILSPLVRSIIDSLGNIRDNQIILPDFRHEEIEAALDIIDGARDSESSLVFFSSTTKRLLESLGIDLKKTKTFNISTGDNWGDCIDTDIEISNSEREEVDEEDMVQEMLLAENLDLDSSDDEEDTGLGDVTVDEHSPGLNIKLEKPDVTEDVLEDHKDIQDLLLFDQDLSDSDDDSDESMTIPVQNDNNVELNQGERVTNVSEAAVEVSDDRSDLHQQKLEEVEEEKDTSNLEKFEEVEKLIMKDNDLWRGKSCNKTFAQKQPVRRRHSGKHRQDAKVENIQDVSLIEPTESEKKKLKDLHQQTLKELKNFAIEGDGCWKCKECSKTFLKRINVLYHAELHVSGLYYPCNHCTKNFNTRSRLAQHRYDSHQDKVKKYKKSKR